VHAVGDVVIDLLEQLQFVDELPVAAEPSVGGLTQQSSLLVGEVGLGVDQPDRNLLV